MRHSMESIFVVDYLREFASMCKTVLAHESGDPCAQYNEKSKGWKSRETVPLTLILKAMDFKEPHFENLK
jgi:hypothetical protein